ncbi:MAG: pyruvate dehydrogenase complex dihydrolipoamide acetyltransferase [Flavobacteriales bacterium]|nr:pyruvate dehydrogenase complex dihydrolipoamide acetyltransferase [Flavobacteriales bacterium]
MAEIVRMPKLSDTMTEGTVASWNKKVGDKVKSGEVLAEIETDKATMEFESFQDGVLLYIGVEKGKTAKVDSILAILGKEGEDVTAMIASESAGAPIAAVSAAAPVAVSASVSAPTSAPVVASAPVAAPITHESNGRLKASPLAKKLASEKGIDISHVAGSGDGGRIIRRDVENFSPASASSKSTVVPVFAPSGTESFTEENISQMRKTIARRLAESKFTAPHFYLTMEINMDNAMAARKSINDSGDVKISFNDMVVKAVAMSLLKHPKVNSSWRGETIRYNQHVHIGVAVAVDEGLLVPVVRFANEKGLAQIGAEVKSFAEKAKTKKLQPSDWEGNTFTISNLGMFGIDEFTAIINPPDSCILAVGGIKAVPVVKNGAVVPGNVMKVTLSCDHRAVDGATGAAFLQTLKSYLENPVMMLV